MTQTKIIRRTRKQAFNHWIKALKSGKYEQTTGTLKNYNGFCCLGVLCDLASKDGGPEWEPIPGCASDYFMDFGASLPDEVRDFMGISEEHENILVEMNDGEDKSFKEIAKYIEDVVMPESLNQ